MVSVLFGQCFKTGLHFSIDINQVRKVEQDSSVNIVTNPQAGKLGFNSCRGRDSSLHHHVQTRSGSHPASSPVGTGGYFPGGKAAEA